MTLSLVSYVSGRIKYLTLQDSRKVWMPDTFFRNEKHGQFHNIIQPNLYIRVFPNGDILYSIRYWQVLALARVLLCGCFLRSAQREDPRSVTITVRFLIVSECLSRSLVPWHWNYFHWTPKPAISEWPVVSEPTFLTRPHRTKIGLDHVYQKPTNKTRQTPGTGSFGLIFAN